VRLQDDTEPKQNNMIVPSGQRQVKWGAEATSMEAVVAHTSIANAVLRSRRMMHPYINYQAGAVAASRLHFLLVLSTSKMLIDDSHLCAKDFFNLFLVSILQYPDFGVHGIECE
jgi:hypothetical protein